MGPDGNGCCVYAVPGQVIFVLILHVFTHKSDVSTDEYGNPDSSHVEIGEIVTLTLPDAPLIQKLTDTTW